MKRILLSFCILFSLAGAAQVFDVDTILYSGDKAKRINIVIVGDGFTQADMPQLLSTSTNISNYLFGPSALVVPFSQYKNYFNVFVIKAISAQSGVSHPGTATDVTEPVIAVSSVNNFFSTQFDFANIHRLIVATDATALSNVVADNLPDYDLLLVIGNSPEYGGSGGSYITMSMNTSSRETAAHEMGHSFAGLSDEYWAGPQYAHENTNMTAESNAAVVKWNYWVGQNGIGVYPYGTSGLEASWYRPHQNCKMQYLNSPYCSVCKQAIIERIHTLTNPIDSFFPANNSFSITPGPVKFRTRLLEPSPNSLKVTWELNTHALAWNVDSLSLMDMNFSTGSNTVKVTVNDTNLLSREPTHAANHQFSVVWSVYKGFVGVPGIENVFEFSTFPNPSSNQLHLSYSLTKAAGAVKAELLNMQGQPVVSASWGSQGIGKHEQQLDLSSLAAGTYFITCSIDQQTITHQIIISR